MVLTDELTHQIKTVSTSQIVDVCFCSQSITANSRITHINHSKYKRPFAFLCGFLELLAIFTFRFNMDTQAVVARLEQRAQEDEDNLEESSLLYLAASQAVEEGVSDSDSPVIDSYMQHGGNKTMTSMTNFTVTEFDNVWSTVEDVMVPAWTLGRGRRSRVTPKDAFFMALAVLKHYDTWEKHALDFGMKAPTFEKLMQKVYTITEPVLFAKYVKEVTMHEQVEKQKQFRNYPYALYATDVKFQPAYRPSGRFSEQKRYFSGKHKQYGFKLECSVAYPGRAIDLSDHQPGSVSDLTMFLDRQDIHRAMLQKTAGDAAIPDRGERSEQFDDSWAVLVDKGYQGAQDTIRTIQPKRQPRGGVLDHTDLDRNRRVSSDRVLVENYFGRVCSLWNVMYVTFKWNESSFDMLSRISFALTNAHVSWMPLRGDDGVYYQSVLARYFSMAEQKRCNKARTQKNYLIRRNRRLSLQNQASPSTFSRRMARDEESQEF